MFSVWRPNLTGRCYNRYPLENQEKMRLFFYSLKSFISPPPAADGQIESGQSQAYFQAYF